MNSWSGPFLNKWQKHYLFPVASLWILCMVIICSTQESCLWSVRRGGSEEWSSSGEWGDWGMDPGLHFPWEPRQGVPGLLRWGQSLPRWLSSLEYQLQFSWLSVWLCLFFSFFFFPQSYLMNIKRFVQWNNLFVRTGLWRNENTSTQVIVQNVSKCLVIVREYDFWQLHDVEVEYVLTWIQLVILLNPPTHPFFILNIVFFILFLLFFFLDVFGLKQVTGSSLNTSQPN